jgi:hypothetical protein
MQLLHSHLSTGNLTKVIYEEILFRIEIAIIYRFTVFRTFSHFHIFTFSNWHCIDVAVEVGSTNCLMFFHFQ